MDSNEWEKKRDVEELKAEVGAAGEKKKDCAGGEGQGKGGGSKKGKRGVEKKEGRFVGVEESKRIKKKEREKREDWVGSCRYVRGRTGVNRREEVMEEKREGVL